jgi:hypothetical protein
MRTIALETFKIINKKSPLFIQDLFIIKNNLYNFRYTNIAEVPRPRTSNYGKKSFRYEAAQVWNSLPNEARIMTSFDQFKKYINSRLVWRTKMYMQCMPYPTSASSHQFSPPPSLKLIFHTKYPNNFRASLRSAQVF